MATSPNAFLQLLLGAGQAPASVFSAPPPQSPPPQSPPQAQPAPPPPAPPPPAAPSAGSRFGDILRQLAPVLLANVAAVQGGPVAAAGLLRGYSQAQQRKREEAEKQAALDAASSQSEEERNFKIAQARQSVMQSAAKFQADQQAKLSQFTNPAERASFIQSAERYAQQAFGVQPGWFQAPPLDTHAQDVKDAQAQLGLVQKTLGDNFDAAVAHHATTTFKGKRIPLGDLQALAGEDVTDPATGQPFVAPTTPKSAADLVTGTDRFANLARAQIRAAEAAQGGTPLTAEQAQKIQLDAYRDIAGLSGPGADGASLLTPEGLDYAATQFRVTGSMPPLGMGKTPDRARIINETASQAKMLGQTPAVVMQKQSARKADASALTKMTSMQASAQSYESKALAQADIVDNLSRSVPRSQFPIVNRALLAGQANIVGDTNTQLLYNALTTFTTEYAKIMEGSTGSAAASSDSARAAAARLVSAGLNKDQLTATIDLMRREMKLTIDGYQATIDHINERLGGSSEPSADQEAGFTVDLPDGRVALFKTQREADAFRQKHGLD